MATFRTPLVSMATSEAASRRRRVFTIEGLLLLLLGLAAVALPAATGLVTTIFLGWIFLMAGAVGLAATFLARPAPGLAYSLLSAFVELFAGTLLITHPLQGLLSLTLVLTLFFLVDGAFNIALGFTHRRGKSSGWPWLVVNGAMDLILAAVVISGLPGTLAWALGLLVGADLIFAGAALVALGRDEAPTGPIPGFEI